MNGGEKVNYYDFHTLDSSDGLIDYLDNRHFSHSEYFHYSSLENINSIIKNNEFWIGQVEYFNDNNDKDQFKDQKRNFSLCFSSGINENLPLWYFYGGISGEGARISLTKAKFKKFYENAKFYLFPVSNKNNRTEINRNEAKIEIKDVLYFKENNGKIQLKYNNLTNYNLPPAEFSKLKKINNGFFKSIAWFYEKETRIHIQLNDEFAKIIKKGEKYYIAMHYDDLHKYAKVVLAPNITEEKEHKLFFENENKYDAIKNLLFDSSRVQLSEYNGSVNFKLSDKLCDNCIKKEK